MLTFCAHSPPHCRLKAFLDSVTPEDWFQSQAAAREAKKAALRAEWRATCDALAAHKGEAAAAKQRAEHDMQWARTQQQWERAERVAREAAAALREALAQQASCCVCVAVNGRLNPWLGSLQTCPLTLNAVTQHHPVQDPPEPDYSTVDQEEEAMYFQARWPTPGDLQHLSTACAQVCL